MNKLEENKNLCTLYLVRHGETEWNVKGIIQGQTNSDLTEKGIEQAKKTGDELKDIHFDAIFSSDSTRAHNTAEIIKLDRELIIETSHLLRERNFGKFEGKHGSEFLEAFRGKLKEKETLSDEEGWNFTVSNDSESDGILVSRFIMKLREIAVAYPNKTVLVVSHGGPIRMFLAKIGYKTKKELSGGTFKNGGYVKVLSDGVNFILQSVKGVELAK